MASAGYLRRVVETLEQVATTCDELLETVARRCAQTIADDGFVHLFGSGHSNLPVLDAFPRYGSFVGFDPLVDPRLLWHAVLGSGGVPEMLWIERAEGYVENFLRYRPLNPGDVLIAYSHSGNNAATIEAVEHARAHGLFTVGVTSLANADRPAVHSRGKRLAELCDVVIDTGVPAPDAAVAVDGWPVPIGPLSTVIACAITHEIITRTAAALARVGRTLPTFVAPTARPDRAAAVQEGPAYTNDAVFDAHRRRLAEAERRALQLGSACEPSS